MKRLAERALLDGGSDGDEDGGVERDVNECSSKRKRIGLADHDESETEGSDQSRDDTGDDSESDAAQDISERSHKRKRVGAVDHDESETEGSVQSSDDTGDDSESDAARGTPVSCLNCHICEDNAEKTYRSRYWFQMPVYPLLTAAKLNCNFCTFVADLVRPYCHVAEPREEPQSREREAQVHVSYDPPSSRIFLNFELTKSGDWIWLHLTTLQGRRCPWPIIAKETPRSNCGPAAAAAKISTWMSVCTTSERGHDHDRCSTIPSSTTLPTRILEILGPTEIRLVVTNQQNPQTAQYGCLSHCWGKTQCIKTTLSTLEGFQTGVPWACMPQTFKDVVELTSHLGLRYLWIDSLCIVQDSLDDWRHEGSNMASIYASSYVTIAATRSPDPEGGLYDPAFPCCDAHLPESTAQGTGLTHDIRVRYEDPEILENSTAGLLPLLTRAWVLQERFLSPRIVHFGTKGLSWECNSVCLSETASNEVVRMGLSKDRMHRSEDKTSREQWQSIVSEYTRLSLSFEQDIFPALQGIAKHVADQRNTRYLAGLWEDTLFHDLFWIYPGTWPGNRGSSETQVYRAPTWSWASRTGDAEWWTVQRPYTTSARINFASTTPVGDDAMGELQDGKLGLKGVCIPIPRSRFAACRPEEWCVDDGESGDSQYANETILLMEIFHNLSPRSQVKLCLAFKLVSVDEQIYVRRGAARISRDSPSGLYTALKAGACKDITVI